ncbi:HlyD family efflux transporter periplasmic adaptor subunit [Alteromonadaceae bacterium M269]|nr:HlyD family efflux transporter periplasmic adaptor subunit [Alteromonadaceae bacterium M269]
MDVVKKKQSKGTNLFTKTNLSITSLVAVTVLFFGVFQKSGAVAVKRQDILIESVQRGDLDIVVEGYGTLTSNRQQLITSFSSATVKEIVLKPGAQVNANSVIAYLENPELNQQLEDAQQELIQTKANLRQLKLTNQREKLNEEAALAEIKSQYEAAALKKAAEEKLIEEGIVSQLTYQQSVLDEKQLKERIEIQTRRNQQLTLVHEEAVKIQQERVKQQQGRLNIAQSRLDKLTIKAGFDGVLQRLSVELGQSLTAGQEVALIGSVTDLIALIRVPQSQAQLVSVGKPAVIDTRRDKITGTVSRIDPVVEDNTVEIEISLPKNLPASARPQLNVDGSIIADRLEDVKYIKRPAGSKSNTEFTLYKVSSNTKLAESQAIRFGAQAGQNIQILAGAEVDEQFIISDLSNLQTSNNTLTIN